MTHGVIIRIEAEVDITDAAVWYEQQQAGVGHEFLAEVEFAISAAAENPFCYPRLRRTPEVRLVLMQRFPYRVFFHPPRAGHRRLPRAARCSRGSGVEIERPEEVGRVMPAVTNPPRCRPCEKPVTPLPAGTGVCGLRLR